MRELQNVIERGLITRRSGKTELLNLELAPSKTTTEDAPVLSEKEIRKLEKENLRRALKTTRWKIYGNNGAVALLGIKPTTLSTRMKAFGIKRPV